VSAGTIDPALLLTEEDQMLREMLARYVADNYDIDRRRRAVEDGVHWRPDVWRELAELGVLGAGLPEALGGFGGGAVAHMLIMEQLGAALALEPYLDTAVIGGGVLAYASEEVSSDLAAGVMAGDVRFALAQTEPRSRYNLAAVETRATSHADGYVLNGYKAAAKGAAHATHLIVTARTSGDSRDSDGISIFVVPIDAPGIDRQDYALVDGHAASDIRFDNVVVQQTGAVGQIGKGLPILEAVVDAAIAATCAEAVGVLRRLLDDTVDYTKQRRQFGRALSEFQALRHRMVDMFIKVEEAASMTHMATLALSWQVPERRRAIAAAKVCVGRACQFVGQNAVQLHGAIGTTEELGVSHYFKRALLIENQFGSVDHHLAQFIEMTHANQEVG
jgi:alkylation response protein AidB-like acyl-CoA dehydrogenase